MSIPTANSLGIYVSIPFCRAKCSYCNFASDVFGSQRMDPYIGRVTDEIHGMRQTVQKWSGLLPAQIDSIYLGGGTPSLCSYKQLQDIVNVLHSVFNFAHKTEMTLECAPGQLSDSLLSALPALGFNRVSLGVQSFVDKESAAVGRLHTREIVVAEIARLRRAGIEDINVDLMAGLPHQTLQSWQQSLDEAVATGVPHLSVYMLDVDEDSRLGREMLADGKRYGATNVPDEQAIAAMYEQACRLLSAAGIAQYEISNFARPGYESRHNLKYWTRQPYLGFGLDAHSFLHTENGHAIRVSTTDDLTRYLDKSAPETVTLVSDAEAVEEAWFLGLRLNAGVSLSEIELQIGSTPLRAFDPVLEQCECEGLIEREANRVRLTGKGRLFANEVFTRFLGVADPAVMSVEPERAYA